MLPVSMPSVLCFPELPVDAYVVFLVLRHVFYLSFSNDIMLPVSMSSVLCFPEGHPVDAYVVFLVLRHVFLLSFLQ
jgi:hypothetical protein